MLPTILPQLTELFASPEEAEKRLARRLAPISVTPCLVYPLGDDGAIPAWVHNLSIRGVGILVDRPYPAGTTITALLINSAHTYAMSVQAVVVRSYRVFNGDYFLGCSFEESLNYDQITPFLM
jgi:hypothetical protein